MESHEYDDETYGDTVESDSVNEGLAVGLPSVRGTAYRAAVFDNIPPDVWFCIVWRAVGDALEGDYRAREWLQRLLGIANAARVDTLLRAMEVKITHFQVLADVEAARSAQVRGDVGSAIEIQATSSALPEINLPPTYWSIVLQAITPDVWGEIVEIAREQAVEGDPRAREWIGRVLGIDNAIETVAKLDWERSDETFDG